MTFMQSFLKELEREAITTRKMLERVPDDKYSWKPHEKSMSLQQLATHVAEIPGWIQLVLTTPELDFAGNQYQPTIVNNRGELLNYFEKSLEKGKKELVKANDSQLDDTWTMRAGDKIFSNDPKSEVLRGVFCQVVHHRAQLGVYLRLLNVPIPGSYGPSADETL
jgi:uncharacterized damage-inducible protein DinB